MVAHVRRGDSPRPTPPCWAYVRTHTAAAGAGPNGDGARHAYPEAFDEDKNVKQRLLRPVPVGIAVIVIAGLVLVGVAVRADNPTDPVVLNPNRAEPLLRIGYVGSLSGRAQPPDAEVLRGVRVWLHKLETTGGIPYGAQHVAALRLEVRDSHGSPRESPTGRVEANQPRNGDTVRTDRYGAANRGRLTSPQSTTPCCSHLRIGRSRYQKRLLRRFSRVRAST